MSDWDTVRQGLDQYRRVDCHRAEAALSRLEEAHQAMREALEREWEINHAEHCRNQWPHTGACHWPRPAALAGFPAPTRKAARRDVGSITAELSRVGIEARRGTATYGVNHGVLRPPHKEKHRWLICSKFRRTRSN